MNVVGEKKQCPCTVKGHESIGGHVSVKLEVLNGPYQGQTFQVPAQRVSRCEQPRKSQRLKNSTSSSLPSARVHITDPAFPRLSGLRLRHDDTNTMLDYSKTDSEFFKQAQQETLDELSRLWGDPSFFFPSWCGVANVPQYNVRMGLWFSQPFKANFYTELPDEKRKELAIEAVQLGHRCPYEAVSNPQLPVLPLMFTCPRCKDKLHHVYDVKDMDTHVCGICAGTYDFYRFSASFSTATLTFFCFFP